MGPIRWAGTQATAPMSTESRSAATSELATLIAGMRVQPWLREALQSATHPVGNWGWVVLLGRAGRLGLEIDRTGRQAMAAALAGAPSISDRASRMARRTRLDSLELTQEAIARAGALSDLLTHSRGGPLPALVARERDDLESVVWVLKARAQDALDSLQRALEALDTEGRRGPPGPRDRQAPHLREVAWQWPGAWWATTDD